MKNSIKKSVKFSYGSFNKTINGVVINRLATSKAEVKRLMRQGFVREF